MSRRKRHVDEEDFDEYAFYDERIRGDAHRRLDDGPPSVQDFGLGVGYLGRVRQSPRSPSIVGDDEIRPSRRRDPSPDDSDRGGERRGFRKVGDAYDPDDVFNEPFVFIEPRAASSAVKKAMFSSSLYRDWCISTVLATDPDATNGGNLFFLKQQRVLDESSSHTVVLNNVQLRGCLYVTGSVPDPLPEAVFVELAVLYDRNRSVMTGAGWNTNGPVSALSWSDVFSPSSTNAVYPSDVDDMDVRMFNFTNPESANRIRVMFRKIYKLDTLRPLNTYARVEGTALNADPLLNYTISLDSQQYSSDGGPTIHRSPSSASCALIDEFVNLCRLPARYRCGESLSTAVDTEGAVYVAIRSSSLGSGRTFNVHAFVNTRLNFSTESSQAASFY